MNIITDKYKPYPLVRAFLTANDIDLDKFARKIGKSKSYVVQRLNGHSEWTQDDMYKALDYMQEPHTEMARFFPPGGRYD